MTFENIIFLIFLWFFFGFQHSFLAQKIVKDTVGNYFGKNFLVFGYRFFYFVCQCIVFSIFWHLISIIDPGKIIWTIPEKYLFIFFLFNLFSQFLLLFSVLLVDANHFIGTKQLILYFKYRIQNKQLPSKEEVKKNKLTINYLFKIVRHPMYLGIILVVITSSAIYTEKSLLNLICLIIYIEIGIFFEERQLIREYKIKYISYQKNVPKINPLFYIARLFYHN